MLAHVSRAPDGEWSFATAREAAIYGAGQLAHLPGVDHAMGESGTLCGIPEPQVTRYRHLFEPAGPQACPDCRQRAAAAPTKPCADDRWPDILPAWFVRHRAPEAPVRQDAADARSIWSRGLAGQRQGTGIKAAEAAVGLQLTHWLAYFSPDGAADSRTWRWWKGGARGRSTGWIRFGIDEHPYRGRRALRRLIEAAGGHDVDLA